MPSAHSYLALSAPMLTTQEVPSSPACSSSRAAPPPWSSTGVITSQVLILGLAEMVADATLKPAAAPPSLPCCTRKYCSLGKSGSSWKNVSSGIHLVNIIVRNLNLYSQFRFGIMLIPQPLFFLSPRRTKRTDKQSPFCKTVSNPFKPVISLSFTSSLNPLRNSFSPSR